MIITKQSAKILSRTNKNCITSSTLDCYYRMEYRPGKETDFINAETFVWQAIFPAFNHPELTEEQRAENDQIVSDAKSMCLEAIALDHKEIFVAYDPAQRRMAGFIIVDKSPLSYPEVNCLIVSRKYWGSGVADGLLRKGLEWVGTNKPVTMSVHYYLDRAIAFFARYGFENTGEPAGDHLIPRLLLLREAAPLPAEAPDPEQLSLAVEEEPPTPAVHNPLEPDLFAAPPAEEIVTEAPAPTPSPLDPVEAAEETTEKPPTSVIDPPSSTNPPDFPDPAPSYRSRFSEIEFEIDYGTPEPEPEVQQAPPTPKKIDFEFAFGEEVVSPEPEVDDVAPVETVDTETNLPPEITDEVAEHPPLELPDLDDVPEPTTPTPAPEPAPTSESKEAGTDLQTLRLKFQDHFMQTVGDLFGNAATVEYHTALKTSDFQTIVDRSLRQLTKRADWESRFPRLAGDLIEYFIVETAAKLHRNTFPQRLLRYQGKEIDQSELFSMINDYLELSSENERVDTDFITISPKRLKNATKNFLLAGPDERIYYLIDQSILGNLKNGFAFTSKGLYWKALLQPNHVAYYSELKTIKIENGRLNINGHFFDTGKREFNLKIALLLQRLGRALGG